MSDEIWLPVSELNNRYEISDYGRLRSVDTFDVWGRIHRGRVLKQLLDRRGYPRMRVSVKNKAKSVRIHRLVAKAFISNPSDLPQVNHKNGDKLNNHVSNLEWVDNTTNARHAVKTGLWVPKTGAEAYRFESPVYVFDGYGLHVETLVGNVDMAAKGYDWRNVNACLYGTRKTHRGMTFSRDPQSIAA